jgi:cytochrome b561
MALRNGPAEFGLVTRVIHWATMLLVIGQLGLGNRIEAMAPGLSNLWLYGLHKTLGFAILALILARITWHIAIPLTGWAGSSATGIDTMIADRWVVPPLVAPSAEGEAFWFRLHDILTKVLFGLIILHMLGALKREMEGDGTLTRMIRGRA